LLQIAFDRRGLRLTQQVERIRILGIERHGFFQRLNRQIETGLVIVGHAQVVVGVREVGFQGHRPLVGRDHFGIHFFMIVIQAE
jgi:hypothetical protein